MGEVMMVERVAEAIAKASGREHEMLMVTPGTLRCARAAIEAMREPTEAMIEKARFEGSAWDYGAPGQVREEWYAMIDAALNERIGDAD